MYRFPHPISSRAHRPRDFEPMIEFARLAFGDSLDYEKADYWAGLRPVTPWGPPVIGRMRGLSNLYVNAGHGVYGWTMSAGSGRLLADLMDGAEPELRGVSAPWSALSEAV